MIMLIRACRSIVTASPLVAAGHIDQFFTLGSKHCPSMSWTVAAGLPQGNRCSGKQESRMALISWVVHCCTVVKSVEHVWSVMTFISKHWSMCAFSTAVYYPSVMSYML